MDSRTLARLRAEKELEGIDVEGAQELGAQTAEEELSEMTYSALISEAAECGVSCPHEDDDEEVEDDIALVDEDKFPIGELGQQALDEAVDGGDLEDCPAERTAFRRGWRRGISEALCAVESEE